MFIQYYPAIKMICLKNNRYHLYFHAISLYTLRKPSSMQNKFGPL